MPMCTHTQWLRFWGGPICGDKEQFGAVPPARYETWATPFGSTETPRQSVYVYDAARHVMRWTGYTPHTRPGAAGGA